MNNRQDNQEIDIPEPEGFSKVIDWTARLLQTENLEGFCRYHKKQ